MDIIEHYRVYFVIKKQFFHAIHWSYGGPYNTECVYFVYNIIETPVTHSPCTAHPWRTSIRTIVPTIVTKVDSRYYSPTTPLL